jgi:hypothetical protein
MVKTHPMNEVGQVQIRGIEIILQVIRAFKFLP